MSVRKPKTLPLNLALKQICILQTPIGYGLIQVTLFLSISRVTVRPTEISDLGFINWARLDSSRSCGRLSNRLKMTSSALGMCVNARNRGEKKMTELYLCLLLEVFLVYLA